MNWLKKAGQIALRVVGIASGFMPMLSGYVPASTSSTVQRVLTDVSDVADVIVTTEQMFAAAYGDDSKKGSDKLRAAVPFVAQILQHSQFMMGKKVKDTAKFQAAVTGITSNFADLLSSLEE